METKSKELKDLEVFEKKEGLELPDESFEIISEKEKLWRDFLVSAETNYLKSEASMLQNQEMIDLAKREIEKEADKNAR